jgi:PTS system nitrogen regulatory IIA component
MRISDFLSPSEVLVNVRATDKHQLLEDLAQKAAAKLDIPADRIVSELMKREELGSTGMGSGVAIPHARLEAIKVPFGLFARLKPAIEFDAIDGQRVDLVFVLLLPAGAEGEQLGALACVARKLRGSADLMQIRRAKNASDFYSAVVG